MGNIGAGEVFKAWLIKREDVSDIDSLIKENDTEATREQIKATYAKPFRYRTLSASEMLYQPITNHLKGKYDMTLFTSELTLNAKVRDKILFDDGTMLMVNRVIPQKQISWYFYKGKFPVILELA